MDTLNLFLIAIFLVAVTAGISYFVFIAKVQDYENRIKKHALALLALNVSHLHDSANYFSLIRNNLETADPKSLNNFCKGAQFHFRSLFEDLKLSIEELEVSSLKSEKSRLSIYQIAAVDLKDLLELELLQISNFNRLEIVDKTNAQNALINGNFTLLSKAIINLVENALQHTKNKIKLSLIDNGSHYEIQVSSTGRGIPEAVINEIKIRELNISNLGHGLSGLSEIMEFHHAEIRIDNLLTDGACIRLIFNKYLSKQIKPKSSLSKTITRPPRNQSASKISYIMVSAFVLVFLVGGLVYYSYNRKQANSFYDKQTRQFSRISKDRLLTEKKLFFKNELINLSRLTANYDYQNETATEEVKAKILDNINPNYRDFISLILLEYQYSIAPSEYLEKLEQEALSLIRQYPNSKHLNYLCSRYYDQQNHSSKAFYYKLKFLTSNLVEVFYGEPEITTIKKFNSNSDKNEIISSYLAINASLNIAPAKEDKDPETSSVSGFIEDEDLLNGDALTNTRPIGETLSEEEKKLIEQAETLINTQNKKLGI
jgi:hypothetical protein